MSATSHSRSVSLHLCEPHLPVLPVFPRELSMDPTKISQVLHLPDSAQSQREARVGAQVPISEAGEEEATATTSGFVSLGGMLSSPHSAQRASSSPTAMNFIAVAPSAQASGNQASHVANPKSPLQNGLNSKSVDLVLFLLLKYRRKEITTRAEILHMVIGDHEAHYSVIFTKAADCMRLMFGLEIIENKPLGKPLVHSYSLVHDLGITYDGMQHGFPGIPKTGLVIVILCIIIIEDDCVSEGVLWRILNRMGLYAGSDHLLCGEPRRLITEHFVQKEYLEYRPVPDSDPPSQEFLWGQRAHAETTKVEVLKFFARVVKQDPISYVFPMQRDEIERSEATIPQTVALLP
ncbi:Melanoma-associated antigen 10 [Microtus ochrogaster]|uniref:Melanoma-associated antigen 10 n=1 Tax=Microtus ochrogaster TaxID=79684 RepID=A0A8J6GFW9_MICOH|nr:Melanoma-associated antigen 10 [Microtus ochrogaster]